MVEIRKIKKTDNAELAILIRDIVVNKFYGDPLKTIAGDPALQTMFENYQHPRSVYYVAVSGVNVKGGCGISSLENDSGNICELQRMFLEKDTRGKGIGKDLLDLCLMRA